MATSASAPIDSPAPNAVPEGAILKGHLRAVLINLTFFPAA